MSTDLTALQSRISALAAAQPFAVHWQIRGLSSPGVGAGEAEAVGGGVIGAGAQTQLAAFSTRKVSLLLACLALVHRGDLHLDQPLAVTEEMKDGVQAGIMKNMAPGVELSLEDHLRQMMITSDNICTQLVFEAIGQVTGDALQWVNDYCSWVGMRATIHREIFPRSGDLAWHHSIEHMTVTSPADQAHLLALLGEGTHDDDAAGAAAANPADAAANTDADPAGAAASLHLAPELCRFAVGLMRQIYTPLLGARAAGLQFAEKNGRGLRGLSQVGLATTSEGAPVAAVAIYAEHIPTLLPDGTPGRLAAHQLFADVGAAVEHWHLRRPRMGGSADRTPDAPLFAGTVVQTGTTRQLGEPSVQPHALAGVGKLFAALALAEQAEHDLTLMQAPVTITGQHRHQAAVGPLRTHTGDLTLTLNDALGLILSTSDAAASLAVKETLQSRGVDLVSLTQRVIDRLGHGPQPLTATSITGAEPAEGACGDLLVGQTTPQDLVRLLGQLALTGGLCGEKSTDPSADPSADRSTDPRAEASAEPVPPVIAQAAAARVVGWMSQVFEPAGLSGALPGYGPRKVPQWSVSGVELRSPSSVFSTQGWSSVMMARLPARLPARPPARADQNVVVCAAAHIGPSAAGGREVSQSFGALGLAAYHQSG